MAHYNRSLSRSRARLRRCAGSHLRPDGRLVPFIPHAARRNGRHSIFAGRHPARAWTPWRILHRNVDDWIYGQRGHRRTQLDHSGGACPLLHGLRTNFPRPDPCPARSTNRNKSTKALLICGAATAGTMMANHLRRRLPESAWRIRMIDRNPDHYCQSGILFMPFRRRL